jgi:hypothetical protein
LHRKGKAVAEKLQKHLIVPVRNIQRRLIEGEQKGAAITRCLDDRRYRQWAKKFDPELALYRFHPFAQTTEAAVPAVAPAGEADKVRDYFHTLIRLVKETEKRMGENENRDTEPQASPATPKTAMKPVIAGAHAKASSTADHDKALKDSPRHEKHGRVTADPDTAKPPQAVPVVENRAMAIYKDTGGHGITPSSALFQQLQSLVDVLQSPAPLAGDQGGTTASAWQEASNPALPLHPPVLQDHSISSLKAGAIHEDSNDRTIIPGVPLFQQLQATVDALQSSLPASGNPGKTTSSSKLEPSTPTVPSRPSLLHELTRVLFGKTEGPEPLPDPSGGDRKEKNERNGNRQAAPAIHWHAGPPAAASVSSWHDPLHGQGSSVMSNSPFQDVGRFEVEVVADALNDYLQEQANLHGVDLL